MKTPTYSSISSLTRFFLLLTICMLHLTAHAETSWWNKEWAHRKKITIDTTSTGSNISEPIGSVAMLVRLFQGNYDFGAGKADGEDIRFVAEDDKTELPFHIEKFDSTIQLQGFVWVKIPDLKPSAKTTIWMYYGNPNAARADKVKETFDETTVLVYHIAREDAVPTDVSGNGNNATDKGTPFDGAMIGDGLRFLMQTPLKVPPTASLAWVSGGSMTFSAWFKPTALAPNQILFSRMGGGNSFALRLENGAPVAQIESAGGGAKTTPMKAVDVNTWHHVSVVVEPAKLSIFLDGELYAGTAATLPAIDGPLMLAGAEAGVEGVPFTGEMDEIQLSKAARPAGFAKFMALSQGPLDAAPKLITFAEQENREGGPAPAAKEEHNYFGIIIKNLTLDGWIVIGILSVMFVISWFVMISKISYLNGVAKSNEAFLKRWRDVASDLTVLDHDDTELVKSLGGRVDKKSLQLMKRSPLFRIYHIGVEEIRHRLANSAGKSRSLSALSMQAIRSSLDGEMVRISHKVSNLIVYLTLSISGGPFLGLLGTVVGVMITFAAVAAAGDVNVNAIAPGIAAALLATVAGLAVAIPALFGYNYILARVKTVTSDIHVFIDEFVSKAAEFYGGADAPQSIRRQQSVANGDAGNGSHEYSTDSGAVFSSDRP